MAKTSLKEREKNRQKLDKTYGKKRLAIKDAMRQLDISDPDQWKKRLALQKQIESLPRDSKYSRQTTRCWVCGRPRAVYRLTGLCRIHMRYFVMRGWITGMRKSSW